MHVIYANGVAYCMNGAYVYIRAQFVVVEYNRRPVTAAAAAAAVATAVSFA